MKLESFIKRLENHKAVNYCYHNDLAEGIISIWKYNHKYVLTWEECVIGNQYNENAYIKDEKHEFAEIGKLLEFLDRNSLRVDDFTP